MNQTLLSKYNAWQKGFVWQRIQKPYTEVKKVKRKQWRFKHRHQNLFDGLCHQNGRGRMDFPLTDKRKAGQSTFSNRKKNQYILPWASLKSVHVYMFFE